jgi:hypothetical protein
VQKDLGPSPPRLGAKPSASRALDIGDRVELLMDRVRAPLVSTTREDQRELMRWWQSISNILEHGGEIDTARIDQSRVFYAGPPSLAGRPVFYFVAGRCVLVCLLVSALSC